MSFSMNSAAAVQASRIRTTRAVVDFTRTGWRKLHKANQKLGTKFIRPYAMKVELEAYITAHEALGISFDTECYEVRYEDGIYLLLRRTQGVWYVTDVAIAEMPVAFLPVYLWQRIRKGVSFILRKTLIGWRNLTSAANAHITVQKNHSGCSVVGG